MMNCKNLLGTVGTALLAFALSACGEATTETEGSSGSGETGGSGKEKGEGEGKEAASEGIVEIFSWWIAPGEIEALQSLFDLHKDGNDGSRIFNAAEESGTEAKAVLTERLEANDPPDLFQENANELKRRAEENADFFVPLNDLFKDNGWEGKFIPEIMENVTVGGQIYGLPVNVHRENALFYNIELFDAHNLEAPETMEDFWNACETLKTAGVTPVATSYQGWILRIMFNSVAMGVMGGEKYKTFFAGDSEGADPAFGEALDAFDRIMTDYINEDAGDESVGWTEAAQKMFDGEAAMFFHGDWAKGYVQQLGWTPGVDFGGVGAPGASEVFLYGSDTFAMPQGGPNPEGALKFLETVASVDGQVAFNKIKGSSPVRSDVAASALDPVAAVTHKDLSEATIRMGVPLWVDTAGVVEEGMSYDDAFNKFATERDLGALKAYFEQTYPGH